jgi:CIC family chloride channel protein
MQKTSKSTLLRLITYPWNQLLRTSDNAAGIVLAILIGIGAGFGALAFWKLIEIFSWLFFKKGADWFSFLGDYYIIILPALGGLIFGPIVYFLAREAKGEGPPEIMEAVAIRGGRIRMRVGAIKILSSSICIGSGGSVGREGPIVQIGGSLGSAVGQLFRVPDQWLQTLVLCGVAGGVSATFNAPIAGAFFALEVIQRRIVARNVGFVILSSVMACIIARRFLFSEKNPTSFSLPTEYGMESNQEILLYIVLGIICAIAAGIFVKIFYTTEDMFTKWKPPAYLLPAFGGLIVGGIGFISLEFLSSGGFTADIFGVGYGSHYAAGGEFLKSGTVDSILLGEAGAAIVLGLLAFKVFATSITLGSGGSGGVFAPSLFMGAAVGSACGSLFGEIFPTITAPVGAYALVGMAAFFAVVVRGPITAILIIFELTGDYEIILPVMTAVVVGVIVARIFSKNSIYTVRLERKGIQMSQLEERDVMKTVTVSQVMSRNFPSVPPDMPVPDLLRQMEKSELLGFPVIDAYGRLQGLVTLTDVHDATGKGDTDLSTMTVDDISTKSPVIAYPDETLHQVLLQLGARDFKRIPVVDRNDPTKFLGVLRRHDIVQTYISSLKKQSTPIPPDGSIVF